MKKLASIFIILGLTYINFVSIDNTQAQNPVEAIVSSASENSIYVDTTNYFENEAAVVQNGSLNKMIRPLNNTSVTQTVEMVVIEKYWTVQGNYGWKVQEGSSSIKDLIPQGVARSYTLDLIKAYKGNIPPGTHTFLVGFKLNGVLNYAENTQYILNVYNLDGTIPVREDPPHVDPSSSTNTTSPSSSSPTSSQKGTTASPPKLQTLSITGKTTTVKRPSKGNKSITFTISMSKTNKGKVEVKRISNKKVLCKVSFTNKKVAKCVYKINKKTKKESFKFALYYTPNNTIFKKSNSKQYTLKIR